MLRVGDVRYTSAFLRHDVTHGMLARPRRGCRHRRLALTRSPGMAALPSKTYVFELVTEHPEVRRRGSVCGVCAAAHVLR